MNRSLNLLFAAILTMVFAIPILIIALAIRITSQGPVIYWSARIGRNNSSFRMPKFRTMNVNAPDLPTHLMKEPDKYLTKIGSFLRKTSLDELPQLWSILKGNMGFVGPRPALFNQNDLIALRSRKGVEKLLPGITGWAQIQGRDELPIPQKVEKDVYYLKHQSLLFDLKIIWLTLFAVLNWKNISH
ncbi:MAG: sugar transferase [Nitrospinae bacterium]|nr:sugar transferase [Nitrospinota bacterium]